MSVGHELLINPSIILLDEPTSGELLHSAPWPPVCTVTSECTPCVI